MGGEPAPGAPRDRRDPGAREYLDSGPRRILGTLMRGLDDRIEDVLPRVGAPVLVVRGEHDPVVPHAWAAEVARRAPDGRLRTVPGRGHAVNYSAPPAVAALVEAFLGEAGRDGG